MGNLCGVKTNNLDSILDDVTIEKIETGGVPDKPNDLDTTSNTMAHYKDDINSANNVDITQSHIKPVDPNPFDRELVIESTREVTKYNPMSRDSMCDIIDYNTKIYMLDLLYQRIKHQGKLPLTDKYVQYIGTHDSLPNGVKLYLPKEISTADYPPKIHGIPVMPLFEKKTFYLYFIDENSVVYETLVAYPTIETMKDFWDCPDYGVPTIQGKVLTMKQGFACISNELRVRSIGTAQVIYNI